MITITPTTLREYAILVSLNISEPGGVPGLDAWRAHKGAVRAYFDRVTLPWDERGKRLLSGGSIGPFEDQMRALIERGREIAVGLDSRFAIRYTFSPVPNLNDYGALRYADLESVTAARRALWARLEGAILTAVVGPWERLCAVLERLVDIGLTRDGYGFQCSLLIHAADTATAIPLLNLTNDLALYEHGIRLAQLVDALSSGLMWDRPEHQTQRQDAAREAARLLRKDAEQRQWLADRAAVILASARLAAGELRLASARPTDRVLSISA